MTNTDLNFEQGGLRIEVFRSEGKATIQWSGESDARNPGALLNGVLLRIVDALDGCKVTVDFRRLQYMNSSTVPPIINLVKRLNARGISCLVLYADGDWQRTQLRCMQTIARTLPHVQVESRGLALGQSLPAPPGSGEPPR
jgi:anti-anti-sigma regulatory factor